MAPLTPEMAQYLLEQNIQRWSENLNVQQKALDFMIRDAQQGHALDTVWGDIQGGKLGETMVHTRGQIQAMQAYLAQARAALAQGGSAVFNAVRSMGSAGVQITQNASRFFLEHKAEAGGLATAAGQAISVSVGGGAAAGAGTAAGAGAAGAVGEATVAAGAIGEATVAAGAVGEATVAAGAIGEATVAAGAVGEATVAAGAIAETTMAAAGTAAVAEGGVAATLATGGASGSWLGPVGIVIGVVVAGVVLGGIYVYTRDDKPAAAISTVSSDSDTDFSTSDSDTDTDTDSERETTTTEAETTTTTLPPPARSLDGSYRVTSTVIGGGTEDLTCTGREATLEVQTTPTTFDFSAVGTSPRGPGDTFTLTLPASSPDGGSATETINGDFDPSVDPPTLSGTATLAFEGGVKCDFTIAGVRVG